MNVTGMVCPRTGEYYALEFTNTDSIVFQAFLDHATQDIKLERSKNIIVCDNATWHKEKVSQLGKLQTPLFATIFSRL